MSENTTTAAVITNPLETVRTIGKGVRMTEVAVPAILATLPDDFDATVRGALTGAVIAWACPDGNVPQQKTGPKGNQTLTDFGRGLNTLVTAVKRALKEDDNAQPDWVALVRQAAKNAHDKGHVSEDAIMAAVREALVTSEDETDE